MAWYIYLVHFVTGFFLLNSLPHLIHGVSGEPFPSPFANPPGKGNSSPVVNALWGFFNLVIGAVLLGYFWPEGDERTYRWTAVALGGLTTTVFLARFFGASRNRR